MFGHRSEIVSSCTTSASSSGCCDTFVRAAEIDSRSVGIEETVAGISFDDFSLGDQNNASSRDANDCMTCDGSKNCCHPFAAAAIDVAEPSIEEMLATDFDIAEERPKGSPAAAPVIGNNLGRG